MPRVRKELAQAKNAILESNSVVRFLKPDLYLTVLDPAIRDFKPSAQYFLDRADAVLWSGTNFVPEEPAWPSKWLQFLRSKPQFFVCAPEYTSNALTQFVRERITSSP
jgi:hypothetical protein